MARLPRKYRYLFNVTSAGKRTRKLRQLMATAGEGSSPMPAPEFTSQPIIVGTSQAGQTLTALDGSAAFAYEVTRQWYLNGVAAGTAQTLTLAAGDVGKVPSLRNFASGPGGGPVQSTLATAVAVIAAGSGATAPGAPTGVVAVAGDGVVSVAFTPGPNGGSSILEHQARLSNGSTEPGVSSPISVASANGLPVTAQVRSRNAVDWGPWSVASNSVTPIAPSIGVEILTTDERGWVTSYRSAGVTYIVRTGPYGISTVSGSDGRIDTYVYSTSGVLTGITTTGPANSVPSDITRDASGRLLSFAIGGTTYTI